MGAVSCDDFDYQVAHNSTFDYSCLGPGGGEDGTSLLRKNGDRLDQVFAEVYLPTCTGGYTEFPRMFLVRGKELPEPALAGKPL